MIIVRIWEGLGNQMFQYAYARKRMAEGVPVSLDLHRAYEDSYPSLRNSAVRVNCIQNFHIKVPSIDVEGYGKYFYLRKQTEVEKRICFLAQRGLWPYSFIEEKNELYSSKAACIRGNVYLKGWFQDQRYFADIRKELLQEFTPKKKIKISSEILKMIKSENSAAIHVRRGDYVKLGMALPHAYYLKAKSVLEKKIANPIYFVFSDDYQWVKQNIQWGEKAEVFYIDEICKLENYEQLLLMSNCRGQIISNSTFSWWAAWLNQNEDKKIIMPKRYVQLNPGLDIKGSIWV
ncbi:alpha-1,2-fucosyltransferase [Candidatus Merdisoma sp. JLR.KK011]|jgi:hypothetical protein|uniref:alpha-1,2-fucosyltransferase n=1 Tax=Candidatus Merdisoma sp. JLR.KK011 TaxID=3114299 RepID=UPI002FF03429